MNTLHSSDRSANEDALIDFSNNVNFLGPPKGFEKFAAFSTEVCRYPDRFQTDAKQALAQKFGVSTNCVSLSIGATELLSICPTFSKSSAVIITPSFWEYQYFYEKFHGCKKYFPYNLLEDNKFEIDYLQLSKLIKTTGADICYLANPNNPTTSKLDKQCIKQLILEHENVLFIVDETYLPFSEDFLSQTLSNEASYLKNLIVIGSFSKIYALPGIRLGFGISSVDNTNHICKHLIPYGVPPYSLRLLQWLVKQEDYLSQTWDMYEKSRNYLIENIKHSIDPEIKLFDSGTAFVLLKFETSDPEKIHARLKNSALIVRSGEEFSGLGSNFCRISLRSIDDLNTLVKVIGLKVKLN